MLSFPAQIDKSGCVITAYPIPNYSKRYNEGNETKTQFY